MNSLKYILLFIFILFLKIVFLKDSDIDNFTVNVKIAKTDKEKKRGLMFVKNLKFDQGMLFPNIKSVWMKNTYIPLDVIFLDNNYIVIGYVEDTMPFSLDSVTIDKDSNHILEVNSGFIRHNKIKIGDKLNMDYIDYLL